MYCIVLMILMSLLCIQYHESLKNTVFSSNESKYISFFCVVKEDEIQKYIVHSL